MLTEFGKVSRKLRIDHSLTLKEVADQMEVSSAYLSGVETGRKPLSMDLVNKVISVMRLSVNEVEALLKAAGQTLEEVKLSLADGRTPEEKEVALMFARRFGSSDFDAEKWKKLLEDN